jgi:hypothetical protein
MLPIELSTPMEPNATMRFVEALNEKHSNAIPIFGGAIFIDGTDFEKVALYLPSIIRNAEFFKWHDTLANACRVFCHCLFVDPMLVEALIGSTFEELVEGLLCLNLDV